MTGRRWLAPEVVQTSNMDCGPASLKCLLEGYGVRASYGRLREACQTDVDGTSIDTLEEVALKLGLQAEQVMLPVDHLLIPEAKALPALVVVHLPNGGTHFVVLWRKHGRLLQIMDPATGRRWLTAKRFLSEVYVHSMEVPAEAWREWAGSENGLAVLRRRMRHLGVGSASLDRALSDPSWRGLAVLDAGLRMIHNLGRQAARLLEKLCARDENIPASYWSVRPASEGQLTIRGSVLLTVRGVNASPAPQESPELAAALAEKPVRPGLELLRLLRADGVIAPVVLVSALLLASGGVVAEAFLLRVFFDLARELGLAGQRIAAVIALVALLLLLLLFELPLVSGLLRYGRRLEVRLRQAFLEKIPRLSDRYFQSRLKSDMAERSHAIHQIRHLPELGSQILRGVFELALTTAGIAWLDPASGVWALLAAGVSALLPLAAQPVIIERDLRLRTHTGALSRFYLDALLGLVAIRAHGAEGAVRREHSRLLGKWAHAGLGLQRAVVLVEALQLAAGYGLAAWLLFDHLARRSEDGATLLLAYWALSLPVIGQRIAIAAWQYPAFRNVTLRLIEPLGALEEQPNPAPEASGMGCGPVGIEFEDVSVVAAGHTILESVSASIAPGSHIAMVGPSGAGKSSLVGLLLGWHRPAKGQILVDGAPLDGCIESLRRDTAWVDPAVQLWNRSLYENLRYGSDATGAPAVGDIIETADLRSVLEKLPDGFETSLGEGGALVSGGEGQRVRLGRAMLRPGVRLVILDEPFRGLDREQQRELLTRARRLWKNATLLCITHDIAGTRIFDRVLVIDRGRIVEDDNPARLAEQGDSRYRALLDIETATGEALWKDSAWRHVRMEQGRVGMA